LKGSGRTPFSRGGDGRASLGPVLRELIIAEAMHALGIPTTRSLAAVITGEPVFRQATERGAILTRVASSHVRVGTFEYFAARDDVAGLRALLQFAIERHQPEAVDADDPAVALLRGTMERQARLVARWMGVGFIHGVMNTDNTTISGETIDYGPCAFMDTYDPATVYSSIDRRGRYAYGAQPAIIAWNMARLAQALLPVIDSEPEQAVAAAQELLDGFPDLMERAWLEVMAAKLGIASVRADDRQLIMSLLTAMDSGNADFTNTFRGLVDAAGSEDGAADVRDQFDDPAVYDGWAPGWRERLAEEVDDGRLERMRRANPAFIPRNHRVEEALAAAIESDDYQPLESLMEVLRRPYDDQPEAADFREPPAPAFEDSYRTFCGT
ncbi:MAG: YdiU family protein, partial [Deltaproteobacteria bacterium]|nr:YdiU family protein [Deltaproteobacteria bacterium]